MILSRRRRFSARTPARSWPPGGTQGLWLRSTSGARSATTSSLCTSRWRARSHRRWPPYWSPPTAPTIPASGTCLIKWDVRGLGTTSQIWTRYANWSQHTPELDEISLQSVCLTNGQNYLIYNEQTKLELNSNLNKRAVTKMQDQSIGQNYVNSFWQRWKYTHDMMA